MIHVFRVPRVPRQMRRVFRSAERCYQVTDLDQTTWRDVSRSKSKGRRSERSTGCLASPASQDNIDNNAVSPERHEALLNHVKCNFIYWKCWRIYIEQIVLYKSFRLTRLILFFFSTTLNSQNILYVRDRTPCVSLQPPRVLRLYNCSRQERDWAHAQSFVRIEASAEASSPSFLLSCFLSVPIGPSWRRTATRKSYTVFTE